MAQQNYQNLDILLHKQGDGFQARIITSPAGQASCDFELPGSTESLGKCVSQYTRSRSFELGNTTDINHQHCSKEKLKELGTELFNTLFKDRMRQCLNESLNIVKDNGLRIRLQFSNDVPELASLPWEYLYDPKEERFLSLSSKTPLIRYPELTGTSRTIAVDLPLRILVVISSPNDLPALQVDREWENLQKALELLSNNGKVVIRKLETASAAALQHELQRNEYHILHYIGHSDFNSAADEAVLLFEDAQGGSRELPAESLGKLLRDEKSIRLVILNSCEGSKTSNSVFFSGVALSLIKKKIPSVIAMQFEITDEAAITFSSDFYTALANGFPIEAALTEARKAIDLRLNYFEWGTPTLYMRSSNGQLFQIAQTTQNQPLISHQTGTGDGGEPNKPKEKFELQKAIVGGVLILSILAMLIYAFKGSDSPSFPDDDKTDHSDSHDMIDRQIRAGFDCNKARTATERAICSSHDIAGKDIALNEIFADVISDVPPPLKRNLEKQQQAWLKQRDHFVEQNCISSSGSVNSECVIGFYQQRIIQLAQVDTEINPEDMKNVLVIDPPSNIRNKPKGEVLCQVRSRKRIDIYRHADVAADGGKWYWTGFCGMGLWGAIHESQIRD